MSNHRMPTAPPPPPRKEVPVGIELKDQKNPSLSGDLNANGFSVIKVKNLECETVNGKDFTEEMGNGLRELARSVRETYAMRTHKHPEVDDLRRYVDKKIEDVKPTKEYADKEHSHEMKEVTGLLPLDRVLEGELVKELLNKDFAEKNHVHLPLEAGLKEVKEAADYATRQLAHKADAEALAELKKAVEELAGKVRAIKFPAFPHPEIVARVHEEEEILIPRRCDGLTLTEVSAKVQVTITRDGKPLKTGSTVSVDDVLSIRSPSPCLVRLLFS